jgi:hypothetical protein
MPDLAILVFESGHIITVKKTFLFVIKETFTASGG